MNTKYKFGSLKDRQVRIRRLHFHANCEKLRNRTRETDERVAPAIVSHKHLTSQVLVSTNSGQLQKRQPI